MPQTPDTADREPLMPRLLADWRAVAGALLRNHYILAVAIFLLWILVIDEDNLFARYRYERKIASLEAERARLTESIEQDRRKMDELRHNRASLEKFAREEYYMRRDGEVIFIIK